MCDVRQETYIWGFSSGGRCRGIFGFYLLHLLWVYISGTDEVSTLLTRGSYIPTSSRNSYYFIVWSWPMPHEECETVSYDP